MLSYRYDTSGLTQTGAFVTTPDGDPGVLCSAFRSFEEANNCAHGGIWMAGAGLAADNSGNIFVLDGNGDFDTTLNGSGAPANGNYGNAFLKISTSGGLAVADYFEMDNESSENGSDTDLGSGGALVLPDQTDGAGTVWHLAVGAGKDGNLYLVNRDSMGKFSSSNNNIYQ